SAHPTIFTRGFWQTRTPERPWRFDIVGQWRTLPGLFRVCRPWREGGADMRVRLGEWPGESPLEHTGRRPGPFPVRRFEADSPGACLRNRRRWASGGKLQGAWKNLPAMRCIAATDSKRRARRPPYRLFRCPYLD